MKFKFHLSLLGAIGIMASLSTPAYAEERCGSRSVQITGWGSNWVQINLSTMLTLTDSNGDNASRNSSFINAEVDYDLEFFTIAIGGQNILLRGGETRTLRIPGPTTAYNTVVSWCKKR